MPFIINTEGRNATLRLFDKFSTPIQPGSFPVKTLKGVDSVEVELDADFSNSTATIQTCNMLGRVAVSSLTIVSARGLAIALATVSPVVTVAKGGVIEFGNLPKDATDTARNMILAKLSARLGESQDTIASWFAKQRKLNDAEASALFAKADGFKAKALIGRDGKLDHKRIFNRWNAARGKANA